MARTEAEPNELDLTRSELDVTLDPDYDPNESYPDYEAQDQADQELFDSEFKNR